MGGRGEMTTDNDQDNDGSNVGDGSDINVGNNNDCNNGCNKKGLSGTDHTAWLNMKILTTSSTSSATASN
jgi:hypothetical protein